MSNLSPGLRPSFLAAVGTDVVTALEQIAGALARLSAEESEVALRAMLNSGFLVVQNWSSRQAIQEDAEGWLEKRRFSLPRETIDSLSELARSAAIRADPKMTLAVSAEASLFSLINVLSVADGEFLSPQCLLDRLAPIIEWSTEIRLVDSYFMADPDKDEQTQWIKEFAALFAKSLEPSETKRLEVICLPSEMVRTNTKDVVSSVFPDVGINLKVTKHLVSSKNGRYDLHDRVVQFSRNNNARSRSFALGAGPSSWFERRGVSLHRIADDTFKKVWDAAMKAVDKSRIST